MTDTMKSKTVAVVMCTYNGEKYLREQLDSILAQTYPIHELIVQDDCSTDSTLEILREYEAKVPFMKVIENQHNMGFNLNFKTACMRATADFIAISDQDDIWMPEKIEKQVNAIGDYNICFSAHTRGKKMETAHIVSPRCTLEALLFADIAGHTMLVRRDLVQREEIWMDKIYYDWCIVINSYFYGEKAIIKIDEPLNWHRSHEDEAAFKQNKELFPDSNTKPTYQPYLYGLRNYRNLQSKPNWKLFYSFIRDHADASRYPLQHRMAELMLSDSLLSLLKLCWLCMKHRENIYPSPNKTKGIRGMIRGFFYPFIFSYRCSYFDLKR